MPGIWGTSRVTVLIAPTSALVGEMTFDASTDAREPPKAATPTNSADEARRYHARQPNGQEFGWAFAFNLVRKLDSPIVYNVNGLKPHARQAPTRQPVSVFQSVTYYLHTTFLFAYGNMKSLLVLGCVFAILNAAIANKISIGPDVPAIIPPKWSFQMVFWSLISTSFNSRNRRKLDLVLEDTANKLWRFITEVQTTSALYITYPVTFAGEGKAVIWLALAATIASISLRRNFQDFKTQMAAVRRTLPIVMWDFPEKLHCVSWILALAIIISLFLDKSHSGDVLDWRFFLH
ncbi:hypothetical protein NUW58_g3219 [Xylaria curta]|uniref:Uncharacterized protein n=1 Tax=Xylaria curta TaxID=42375 RepID=A0ACC1PDJ5_9PEZI|nr:hypothetical protein NUW58_g3219 [Xylaria curta]